MNKYKIKIGNCVRFLPLIKADNLSYYSFNMLGDTELNIESAKELSKLIKDEVEVIVTIESKSIALVHELAKILNHKKYIIVRKSKKSYMRNEISVTGNTIISGNSSYYLDGIDVEYLKGKTIAVVDDVISTCGTIEAIYNLLKKVDLTITQFGCVLMEGNIISKYKGIPVVSCGFIPLLKGKTND